MATVTNRSVIETLLENDGVYPGDPQAACIFEYVHAKTGKVLWAVFYDFNHVDIHLSPFVSKFIRLWDCREGHLAPLGTLEAKAKRRTRRKKHDF